jgi:hypothetical protein
MTDDERHQAAELDFRLDDRRKASLSEGRSWDRANPAAPVELPGLSDPFWRFANDRDITIVLPRLPPDQVPKSPLTDPNGPDFVAVYTYGDLGAVMEMYGHLRAVNPNGNVKIRPVRTGLVSNDYSDYLLQLGGVDFNHVTPGRSGNDRHPDQARFRPPALRVPQSQASPADERRTARALRCH